MEVNTQVYRISFAGLENILKLGSWWWLHNYISILKKPVNCTFKWVNYMKLDCFVNKVVTQKRPFSMYWYKGYITNEYRLRAFVYGTYHLFYRHTKYVYHVHSISLGSNKKTDNNNALQENKLNDWWSYFLNLVPYVWVL